MIIDISNKEIEMFIKQFGKKKENKKIEELEEKYNSLKKEMKEVKQMAMTPNCPSCGSPKVVKKGSRPTEKRGKIQRYRCLNCNHTFSTDTAFSYRMKHKGETIKEALALRKEGYTLSEIAEKVEVSRVTILKWLKKFQPPTEEVTIIKKQKNQHGEYNRKFKIKI